MAMALFCMFKKLEVSTKVPRSKIKFSGGIFPLPECPRAHEEVLGHIPDDQSAILRCVCSPQLVQWGRGDRTAFGLGSGQAGHGVIGIDHPRCWAG